MTTLLTETLKCTPPAESSPYRQFLIGQIMDLFRQAAENETVTHETIGAVIGHDTRKTTGQSLVQAARHRILKESQIVMGSVRGVGWKRLAPEEITKIGPATVRTARRATSRGIANLMCAEFDRLSNEDKIKHSTSMSILGAMQLMASGPTLGRVEKRLIANNTTEPLSETQMIRFLAE